LSIVLPFALASPLLLSLVRPRIEAGARQDRVKKSTREDKETANKGKTLTAKVKDDFGI
jgi:hypothetical protein